MSDNVKIIAVDGPAGSGKSSVSKEVARKLNIMYIDSGAIYRAITWFVLEKFGEVKRNENYIESLNSIEIKQNFNPDGTSTTYVNGEDVSGKIRNEIIAKNIGIISDDRDIREFVNRLLRRWGKNESIIMDGRDIGTVVFPDAHIKIFLEASVDIRAERRVNEYTEMGKETDFEKIKEQIEIRDKEDQSRPFGKLVNAEDAKLIDTSHMSKQSVIEKIIEIINSYSQTVV